MPPDPSAYCTAINARLDELEGMLEELSEEIAAVRSDVHSLRSKLWPSAVEEDAH